MQIPFQSSKQNGYLFFISKINLPRYLVTGINLKTKPGFSTET